MLITVSAIFITLHGLVHLLYAGQSIRLFELQPGMVWPDDSWALSRLLGTPAIRYLGAIACVVAAVLLVAGGAGIFFRGHWWRGFVIAGAMISSLLYLLFWDASLHQLDNQGAIGLLINLALLGSLLLLHWPEFEF